MADKKKKKLSKYDALRIKELLSGERAKSREVTGEDINEALTRRGRPDLAIPKDTGIYPGQILPKKSLWKKLGITPKKKKQEKIYADKPKPPSAFSKLAIVKRLREAKARGTERVQEQEQLAHDRRSSMGNIPRGYFDLVNAKQDLRLRINPDTGTRVSEEWRIYKENFSTRERMLRVGKRRELEQREIDSQKKMIKPGGPPTVVAPLNLKPLTDEQVIKHLASRGYKVPPEIPKPESLKKYESLERALQVLYDLLDKRHPIEEKHAKKYPELRDKSKGGYIDHTAFNKKATKDAPAIWAERQRLKMSKGDVARGKGTALYNRLIRAPKARKDEASKKKFEEDLRSKELRQFMNLREE